MNNDKLTPEELLAQQQREAGAAAAQATGNPLYKSAADFDARFTRMLADEERKEREEQEKKIQRQQAAQAVSDAYSGIFNDVLKAHQGALVTPRDVQQRYNSLDERQKQIYDNYRARMAAIRKQAQDRAAGNLGVAQKAKEKDEDRKLRLALEGERTKREETASKVRQAYYNSRIGSGSKKESQYYIDFGNGEAMDYKDKTALGRNVFGAIYGLLHEKGIIPDMYDKDGNVVPVKTQEIADALVRQYLDYAMRYPDIKSAIYKIVFGVDKDFHGVGPLANNADWSRPATTLQINYEDIVPTVQPASEQFFTPDVYGNIENTENAFGPVKIR